MDFFNRVVPSTTQGPNAESKKLFYSYFRTLRTVKWEHRYLTKQKIENKENILLLLKDFENCEAKHRCLAKQKIGQMNMQNLLGALFQELISENNQLFRYIFWCLGQIFLLIRIWEMLFSYASFRCISENGKIQKLTRRKWRQDNSKQVARTFFLCFGSHLDQDHFLNSHLLSDEANEKAANLIPWPGPHVTPLIFTLEEPPPIAMQSSPTVNNNGAFINNPKQQKTREENQEKLVWTYLFQWCSYGL